MKNVEYEFYRHILNMNELLNIFRCQWLLLLKGYMTK